MDSCPCCKRDFKGYSDFPKIKIVKFERLEVMGEIRVPDGKTYHESDNSGRYELAPTEVVKHFTRFFRKSQAGKDFLFDGWVWNYGGNGYYCRENPNGKKMILDALEPYFKKLEGMVGKEVKSGEIGPAFSDAYYRHVIPGTQYYVCIEEIEREKPCSLWSGRNLDDIKEVIADIEGRFFKDVDREQRVALFQVQSDSGGSISEVYNHGSFAKMVYEGLVEKVEGK